MNALVAFRKMNQQAQEIVIKTHAPLVKRIAYHLLVRLPHSIQFDDLMQSGMLGLLEAVRHYDATKGASFETYASIRIRGHMLDEVRHHDWVPRSVHRNARVIAKAAKKVENRTGRNAKDHEVAEELNISFSEYYALKEATGNQLYGFEDLGITDDDLGVAYNEAEEPAKYVLQEDMINYILKIIENLPEKERLVCLLYYKQDLNLKEIGEVLGVSESRVCQIHSQATLHLRSQLRDSIAAPS